MRPRSKRVPVEELIIYVLLIGIGTIPIYNAVRAGAEIGVEATIGILMIFLGLVGLIGIAAFAWRRRHGEAPLPVARAQPAVPSDGDGDELDAGSRMR